MYTIINDAEMMTINFALCNRIEFLILQIDNYKFSPKMLHYYENELNKVKDLQEKLNFLYKKIPINNTFKK